MCGLPARDPPRASGSESLRGRIVIWAVLAWLGVPLWLIALALLGLFFKRRRVSKLPDVFTGKVRVASGEIPGLKDKFRSTHARWVHDVLIVYRGMGRTSVLPLPIAAVEQPFHPVQIKRMDDPQVLTLQLDGGAVAEVAVSVSGQLLAVGPFRGVALASEPIQS